MAWQSCDGIVAPTLVLFDNRIAVTLGIVPKDVGIDPDKLFEERSSRANDGNAS